MQRLAIEIYKFIHNLGPGILNEIFEANSNTYNNRSDKTVNTRAVKSVFNGTETVSFMAHKIWDMVPENIKKEPSLNDFKLKIKKWLPEKCT